MIEQLIQSRSEGTGWERWIGALLLASGALLAYLCIYEPLEAAGRNEAEVSLYVKGAIFCPLGVVLGAAYLILGKRATKVFGTREHPSPTVWVCCILLLLVGVGLYFYIESALDAMGYR